MTALSVPMRETISDKPVVSPRPFRDDVRRELDRRRNALKSAEVEPMTLEELAKYLEVED